MDAVSGSSAPAVELKLLSEAIARSVDIRQVAPFPTFKLSGLILVKPVMLFGDLEKLSYIIQVCCIGLYGGYMMSNK